MPIHPVTTASPSFIDSSRLYSLARFIRDSGLSYTRIQLAKRDGIELKMVACGRRKFVRGRDGIDFIERLAAHYSKQSNA
jgi:hypothetical protein